MTNKIILTLLLFLLSISTKDRLSYFLSISNNDKTSYSDEKLSSLLENCLIRDYDHSKCEKLRNFLKEQEISLTERIEIDNMIREAINQRKKNDEKIKRTRDKMLVDSSLEMTILKLFGKLDDLFEQRYIMEEFAKNILWHIKPLEEEEKELYSQRYNTILHKIKTAIKVDNKES